ncbi:methyl-accepting chemotaxis protein [Salibacterium salarium]|uniref:methyl-accepting chemotaxis protein n=1 Tax=Salibacterium salarium TaxID=284579 RepID=UPI002787463C|nr:methyl-accepting chemotaxis protein [Salibacterium salarium]MDQ0300083.1 methyl-accepting chemotaxis protein [Salibacterium salarium]
MNIFDSLITAVPYIKEIMREEVMITIFDHEKYVFYAPSKDLDFKHKKGDPLPPKYQNFQMVDSTKTVVVKVPEEEFGVPFESVSIPIKDENGTLVGGLNAAISTKNQDTLTTIIGDIQGISNGLVDKIQHIAAHSEELSATSNQISQNADEAVKKSSNVTNITGVIKGISEQTNLLGLNAAIEAARVGKDGAGFGVVADEVRKLSTDTKDATANVEDALQQIKGSIESMYTDFSEIANSSQEEAKLVTEFMEEMEKLNKATEDMKKFTEKIVSYEN